MFVPMNQHTTYNIHFLLTVFLPLSTLISLSLYLSLFTVSVSCHFTTIHAIQRQHKCLFV